jgi:hypothetical protein
MVAQPREPNSGRDETTTILGRPHIVRAFPAGSSHSFKEDGRPFRETVSRLQGCTLAGAEEKRLPFVCSGDEATPTSLLDDLESPFGVGPR